MRALLLLGLSHILGKKAQLLLNDCYRIQSALGDVMSLTSNDLPKELVVASDQQITLNSEVARASRDVDISFDQGEAVDRWINAVVDCTRAENVELCRRPACERVAERESQRIAEPAGRVAGCGNGYAPALHAGEHSGRVASCAAGAVAHGAGDGGGNATWR